MKISFAEVVESEIRSNNVLITCGLPGTWKTETAQEVAKLKNYPILRTDLIRLEVLESEDVFDEEVASNMNKRELVYEVMFRKGNILAQEKGNVILDATFVTQKLRRRAAMIAAEHNMAFTIMQTKCSEEASIRRILKRTKEKYESNALTRQAYINNKKLFEPVDIKALKAKFPDLEIFHFHVDTEADPPEEWYVTQMSRI